jgi:nitrate reductase NapE component
MNEIVIINSLAFMNLFVHHVYFYYVELSIANEHNLANPIKITSRRIIRTRVLSIECPSFLTFTFGMWPILSLLFISTMFGHLSNTTMDHRCHFGPALHIFLDVNACGNGGPGVLKHNYHL